MGFFSNKRGENQLNLPQLFKRETMYCFIPRTLSLPDTPFKVHNYVLILEANIPVVSPTVSL